MIKGHTKIELTNVKTGERQVVEKDNLVTNAVKDACIIAPRIESLALSISNPLVDNYFGGLLLFQNPIEEKADNYLFPSNNPMIGNAVVNYSTAGQFPEFGSYNAEESSFSIEKGVSTRKYVYDFATSRGNGTISAVSLTNYIAGFVGTGNKSFARNTERYGNDACLANSCRAGYGAPESIRYANDINAPSNTPNYIFAIDTENNCVYRTGSFDFMKTGKLTLYKSHFPFHKLNPTVPLFSIDTIYEVVQIDVPTELINAFSGKTAFFVNIKSDGDNYFVIHDSAYIKPSDTFYLWKISGDLTSNELFSLTNNSTNSLLITTRWGISFDSIFTVCNGYLLYYYGDSHKIIKIKINDSTDVTEIPLNLNKINSYRPTSGSAAKEMCAMGKSAFLHITNGSYGYNFRVDTEADTSYPLNGRSLYEQMSNYTSLFTFGKNNTFLQLGSDNYTPYSSYGVYRNPFTLSTINNLPEPVTKTSDMTMKITYTLTSKIEPEE